MRFPKPVAWRKFFPQAIVAMVVGHEPSEGRPNLSCIFKMGNPTQNGGIYTSMSSKRKNRQILGTNGEPGFLVGLPFFLRRGI